MVNTGHPSNGCGTCKIRRIKCDEIEPICMNCARSKRVCLGYKTQNVARQQPRAMSERASRHRSESGISLRCARTNGVNLGQKRLPSTSNSGAQDAAIDQQLYLRVFLDVSQLVPARHFLNQATSSTLNAAEAGFQSLQESSQSLEARKQLHEKYQLAMRKLRSSLFSPPYSIPTLLPIYLFALYEVRDTDLRQLGEQLTTHCAR